MSRVALPIVGCFLGASCETVGHPSGLTRRIRVLCAAALVSTAFFHGAVQGAGNVAQRVSKSNKAVGITYGYTIDIDPRWSEQPGYRPVKVSITPHEPSAAERQFTIVLKFSAPRYYRGGGESISVEQRMTIPATPSGGKPSASTVTIAVPQTGTWNNYEAEFWEDGTHRPDLDLKYLQLANGYWGPGRRNQDEPIALEIDAQASGPTQFPAQNNGNRGRATYSTNGRQWEGFGVDVVRIPPALLPEQWINLTSVDVVLLTVAELENLTRTQPRRWEALRSWVLAGGNLWIKDGIAVTSRVDPATRPSKLSEDTSKLTAIDRLVEPQRTSQGPAGWEIVEIGRSRSLGMGQVMALVHGDRDPNRPPPVELQSTKIQLWLTAMARNSRTGPRGLPPNSNDDESLLNNVVGTAPAAVEINRLAWDSRMGFDPADGISDFLNFVIPGVGRVPIYTFLVLMTVFVIVIGPLNYAYLRRRGRLHLMIVTVPLCAAIITVGLFSYALASDGLGTRLRVRSYTEIDQRGDGPAQAACWSRLCFYAGLAPSQGLTFSGDIAVLPISADIFDREPNSRSVEWTKEGKQHLKSGWLRSRTLTQFYTVRSRECEARLDFTDANGLRTSNQLGTRIKQLLAADANGKLYHGENLAPGAQTTLTEITDVTTIAQVFANTFKENRPQRADASGYAPSPPSQNWPLTSPLATGTNLSRMEYGLATALQRVVDGKLPPRSYVAIVERSPELEYGTPSATEEASFHVIVGRW